MPRKMTPVADRFWAKVEKREANECWPWIGGRSRAGYGTISLGRRGDGRTQAHRLSWSMANGPIPAGAHIDHICHNPACVNPAHLRPVSNKENHENFKGAFRTSGTGIRGVSWDKSRGKYRVTVVHNYRQYQVGRFDSLKEAAEAARAKRNELFTHNNADRAAHTLAA